ncbi:hypothetical protein DFH28DRAFT_1088080 [Melampsora americana]|nr:hypothetical protein DFH28DRAFT_1088080 [Melampsora americana]
MSYIHSSVFLPKYVLESVVDKHTPRIDPNTFLSKATPKKILEVIIVFYPHFKFTKSAQADHELLRMISLEMVAHRLQNIAIPSQTNIKYIEAPFLIQEFRPEEDPRRVKSAADLPLNRKRKSIFNICCLPYLKNGQYRHAAEGLNKFCETYKVLNQHKLNSLIGVQDKAQDHLHDILTYLTKSHKEIKSLHLQLRHGIFGKLSLTSNKKAFYDRLKCAITVLRSYLALISALGDHHSNLLIKSQASDSSSTAEVQDNANNNQDNAKHNQLTAPQDP